MDTDSRLLLSDHFGIAATFDLGQESEGSPPDHCPGREELEFGLKKATERLYVHYRRIAGLLVTLGLLQSYLPPVLAVPLCAWLLGESFYVLGFKRQEVKFFADYLKLWPS